MHGCGHVQPKFSRGEGVTILRDYSGTAEGDASVGETRRPFTALECYNLFDRITDEDARLLGLNPVYAHPRNLILTALPVPPPHVRPSVARDAVARAEDDITFKLADIIKANQRLSDEIKNGGSNVSREEFLAQLQAHCAMLIDNSIPGLLTGTQRSGKALKTFRERLVGKGGRVRGNLMGKRVDFSARTVITADPILSIHQVGVPRSIALNLTVPERVNRYNMLKLQKLVENGPFVYPGAKYLSQTASDGTMTRYDLSRRYDHRLRIGDVVERHLVDDDTVLFNRQPTLHKMSIMCHKAKILNYSTFRLNLTCTTPYNADFDGDEMNLHAVQTLPAIAEASELMAVPRLIVTAQSNRPVMGIVQDTLLGSRLITKRDVFIPRDVMMNAVLWMTPWDGKLPLPAVLKPVPGKPGHQMPLWTGKQLFSMILPKVNYEKNSQNAPEAPRPWTMLWPEDTRVIIQRGELLTGMLDKAALGNKGGSILHVIMNDISPEDCRDFINNTQRVVNYWLLHRGFSIGVSDSEAPVATMLKVSGVIAAAKAKVREIAQKGQSGELKRQPGQTVSTAFETVTNEALSGARDHSSKQVTEALDEGLNSVVQMVAAGSKGSNLNISQIIACVGQQNVEGKRIPYGFRDRSLPHFCKFDLGPEARGFVENSYLKGLTPTEFFFHMMGGREGLIDTAVKTAETGYIQRRLIKAMEDVCVRYDATVRNSSGEIIQFLYGEDGMDGRWVEDVDFPSYKLDERAFAAAYRWDPDDKLFGYAGAGREMYLDPETYQRMRTEEYKDELQQEAERIQRDRLVIAASFKARRAIQSAAAPMPVNVGRLILNTVRSFKLRPDGVSDLDPVADVIQPVEDLLKRLMVVPGQDQLSIEAQANATALIQAMLRSHLASKPMVSQFRMTKAAFQHLLGELETRFNVSLAPGGEMCGVLAAQSIGEPATQMTLNTFHQAGVGNKNVTLGVPRLRELINIAKQIRTPSVTIYVKEELAADPKAATTRLQGLLEYTVLADVVEESRIVYDPDPTTTVIPEDALMVSVAMTIPENAEKMHMLSPWVLRFRYSFNELAGRSIQMSQIRERILQIDPSLYIIDTGELAANATSCVMHIRTLGTSSGGGAANANEDGVGGEEAGAAGGGEAMADEEKTLRELEHLLLHEIPLRGIPNIRKLYHSEEKKYRWSPSDGAKEFAEPKFETEGTNLLPVLCLPEVDHTRTVSNNIIEVLEVLGIEACRQSLFNEIRNVISYDGSYVNMRHMALLVDVMTFRGHLMAITRHGINRVDSGPLIRSSFEETCEVLMDAAVFSEVDEMRGSSDNVLLGQMVPIGTGHFDLLLDEEKLKAHARDEGRIEGETALGPDGRPISAATPMMSFSPDFLTSPSLHGNISAYSPGLSPSQQAQFSPDMETHEMSHLTPALTPAYGGGGGLGSMSPGALTPALSYAAASPYSQAGGYSAQQTPMYSPGALNTPGSAGFSPGTPNYSPASGASSGRGGSSGQSPAYSPTSPGYSPASAFQGSGSGLAGQSPAYSPTSAGMGTPSSAGYSPTSPGYSPMSSSMGGSSIGRSPAYSPTTAGAGTPGSAGYSPVSGGAHSGFGARSPAYSPQSAAYSPGGGAGAKSPAYSPQSAAYSPHGSSGAAARSPAYSPQSAAYSPQSGTAGLSSPAYSPQSGTVGSSSPAYSPQSGAAAGSLSPAYSPSGGDQQKK
jgi:DNA-directed RNA polymerase II subunit RPB1